WRPTRAAAAADSGCALGSASGQRLACRLIGYPPSQQLATLIAGFQSPGLKGSGSCHGCCLAMGTVPGGTVLSRQAEMLNLFRKRWFCERVWVKENFGAVELSKC